MVEGMEGGGGEKPPDPRSFADIVKPKPLPQGVPIAPNVYKGKPALFLSKVQLDIIRAPFAKSLIGTFPGRRPPIDDIRKQVLTFGLKANCTIGLIDAQHVLIRVENEEDYHRLWLKETWYVNKAAMRISPWTPHYNPAKESPIAPIWVCFPGLPIEYYAKQVLFSIGNMIGKSLKIDVATATVSRPSVARLCIAVNVANQLPDSLFIQGEGEEGFWQSIMYDYIPEYCSHCFKLGHSTGNCNGGTQLLIKDKAAGFVQKSDGLGKFNVIKDATTGKIVELWRHKQPKATSSNLHAVDKNSIPTGVKIISQIAPQAKKTGKKDTDGQKSNNNDIDEFITSIIQSIQKSKEVKGKDSTVTANLEEEQVPPVHETIETSDLDDLLNDIVQDIQHPPPKETNAEAQILHNERLMQPTDLPELSPNVDMENSHPSNMIVVLQIARNDEDDIPSFEQLDLDKQQFIRKPQIHNVPHAKQIKKSLPAQQSNLIQNMGLSPRVIQQLQELNEEDRRHLASNLFTANQQLLRNSSCTGEEQQIQGNTVDNLGLSPRGNQTIKILSKEALLQFASTISSISKKAFESACEPITTQIENVKLNTRKKVNRLPPPSDRKTRGQTATTQSHK